jgi:hypothetical protein
MKIYSQFINNSIIMRTYIFAGIMALLSYMDSSSMPIAGVSVADTIPGSVGLNPAATADTVKRIFIVYSSAEGRDEFRGYAAQMGRLKPFGRVDVCINSPAEKSSFEIPAGSSDWHEYASYDRSVAAFFPDKKLVPFFPEEFISRNREMLLFRAGVLKELGLNAAFRSNEPRFLPMAFFEKYPDLLGPRVDHPRRSVQKEFAPCFHQQGTIDMYHNMVGQLFKNVPGITSLYFSMNDAGSGSCWCDWLYTGPNGPAACRNREKSEGIITMLNVYREEAENSAGHDIEIYFKGMFTDEEKDDLVKKLPRNCYLEGKNYPDVRYISTLLDEAYPVRGLINPLQIIRSVNNFQASPERFILDFWASYSRAKERPETIKKVIDIVVENISHPAAEGETGIMLALKKLCTTWAGDKGAETLYNALTDLDRTVNKSRPALRGLATLYWGVSERQITRPLVFAPGLLKKEEESYFLPYVFNVSIDEARNDFMDIHGGNRELPVNAVDSLVSALAGVCHTLEQIRNAPEQKFLDDLVKSIKIYSCVLRTCGNFNDAQVIRNRYGDVLSKPSQRPDKIPTWTGDKDLLAFNEIMRDELDNTQAMIGLLENGGIDLVCVAQQPFPEDTFILGADLVNQLKKKRKIMLTHWTDIELYLKTPFK